MSVYVDRLRNNPRYAEDPRGWPFRESCHMTADTLTELHAMADKIGLKRSWFQPHRSYPHYDLTKNKRMQAVRHGAVEQRRPVKAKDA